jgi:hypothetical protein
LVQAFLKKWWVESDLCLDHCLSLFCCPLCIVFFVIKYGRKLTIGWKCQEMRQRKLFMLCPLSQVLWEYINVIPVIKVWIINRQNINQYTNVVNFDYRFWKRFSRKVIRFMLRSLFVPFLLPFMYRLSFNFGFWIPLWHLQTFLENRFQNL